MNPVLIAEVKQKSPFGYFSQESFHDQLKFAATYSNHISIHTDPRWGGSYRNVSIARDVVKTSFILAKGIHATDHEVQLALFAGADAALVVGRLPHHSLLEKCWLEPNSLDQLRSWSTLGVPLVWNHRDLNTGNPKDAPWEEVRDAVTGKSVPLIVASYYKDRNAVPDEAWGVIVGEGLKSYVASTERIL